MKTTQQKQHLLELANTIKERDKPLGVGLHNQCWGGLAIEIAKSKGQTTRTYFGMSIHEMKADINSNNGLPPSLRNEGMYLRTLEIAFES